MIPVQQFVGTEERVLIVNRVSYSAIRRAIAQEYINDSLAMPDFTNLPYMLHICGARMVPDAAGRLVCVECDGGRA